MIPTSLGALMMAHVNHSPYFVSYNKCPINVTLAFYFSINHISLSHHRVNFPGMRILM